MAFADLVVAFAWLFGANGALIERHVDAAPGLPSAWLRPVAARSRIVFHPHRDWPMAFYVAPDRGGDLPSGDRLGGDRLAGDRGAGAAPVGRAAASAEAPRVFLFAPYYLAADGLVAAADMPVDVAEYYFHALLETRFDYEMHRRTSSFAASVARRAAELMADVPQAHRSTAYLEAAADFGAHLLSIANEISRLARRQAAAGKDICRLVDHPASLFGLWRRSFTSGTYPGRYPPPEDPNGAAGRPWATTARGLTDSDKRIIVRDLLASDWSGDPARDFAWLCRQAPRPAPP